MTVMMCGRSVGKSTSLSPSAVIALRGALDRPQKTDDQVAHITPRRERIAYLKALLADTPLDAARQEMAALEKGVDDFVEAHNKSYAQPK